MSLCINDSKVLTVMDLKFVSPCIIIQFKQINQLDANSFSSLLLDVYLTLWHPNFTFKF